MFEYSKFNGDVSRWNVCKSQDAREMFVGSPFVHRVNWPIFHGNSDEIVADYLFGRQETQNMLTNI